MFIVVLSHVWWYVIGVYWLRENFADLEQKEIWQSLVFVIGLFVVYDVYTSNAGEMIKEYLAQVITIVIIAFLLRRVETLQRLESEEELSVDDTDYSYIGTLLEQHCEHLYTKATAISRSVTAQQLACESGFRSYSTFSNAFKRHKGITVQAWMERSN